MAHLDPLIWAGQYKCDLHICDDTHVKSAGPVVYVILLHIKFSSTRLKTLGRMATRLKR